ncbi:hypothetical protein SUGI_0193550 [Cryptomeria japonica]|nr:hypothetical protein SUGI_0193550 [Cryptomeria japonica]
MGDLVVGVVVSCNDNKFKINIGSESLASMYLGELLPINQSETAQISCELPANINVEGASESSSSYSSAVNGYYDRFANGRMGILTNKIAATKSVIEEGTLIYAEVLGRSFNGETLLSSRLFARKIAWQRLRQIKHINKPIEITISEWNTGGLVSRIEGLRGFLPKREILNTPLDNFSVLKEYVGTRMEVVIIDVNEEVGVLVVSEKSAWEMRNLYQGSLLQGTIKRLYPNGARVMVDGTDKSGFLHIGNMSHGRVSSVTDLFSVGERVKVMVVRSNIPNKLYFSTANLESKNGLILYNKERVFEEAEQMAAAYRRGQLSSITHHKHLDETLRTASIRTLVFWDLG